MDCHYDGEMEEENWSAHPKSHVLYMLFWHQAKTNRSIRCLSSGRPYYRLCTCLVNTSASVNLAFLHFHLIHPFLSIHPSCLSCLICLICRIHPTRIKIFCLLMRKIQVQAKFNLGRLICNNSYI